MTIIVDFDGTCVTHAFPFIGKDIGAVPVLKRLVYEGHKLILFTMRSDKFLTMAVDWFKFNQIPLYGIQTNPTQSEWTSSPKAHGDIIIDDTCLGIPLSYDKNLSERVFVNWKKVEELLIEQKILK